MTIYLRPATLPEALDQLAKGSLRPLAGGTDIYPATQARALPDSVIDIATLPELRGITQTPEGLRIGACTTWTDLIAADLPPALHALQQAAAEVGGRQIQNAGTIGGNLCNASPAADGVPPLLAVDALVELRSTTETRLLPLSDFLLGPRKTALRPGELLTALVIPQDALHGQSHFLKLGARTYLVISIAMVAARLVVQNGQITQAALAVGSCSATARRLPEVESALIGQPLQTAATMVNDTTVASALTPLDDLRATAHYRTTAAAELIRRAVAKIAEGAK